MLLSNIGVVMKIMTSFLYERYEQSFVVEFVFNYEHSFVFDFLFNVSV